MCGFTGVLSLENKSIDINLVKNMVDVISHRGPDDAGYLFFHTGARHNKNISFYLNLTDKNFKHLNDILPTIEQETIIKELNRHDWDLFLGHRRLAILDVSSLGHQPMSDLSKNIWLVYNGEIYNFKEIRKELEKKGHRFISNTDTEVVIYSYIEWGIDCIKKFNGMFAFALYDNFKKRLYIARDRYGIKPVYYTILPSKNLIFGSEIKSILEYNEYKTSIDLESLFEYFTFQNFLTNKTLWKDIKILEPGHFLEIDLLKQTIEKKQYWDFDFFQPLYLEKETDYINNMEYLFYSAVKRELIADVEVGSYLSGGIDSGSITAIASAEFKKNNSQYLKTFTIGFDLHSASGLELTFDERNKAEYMSYLFQTEHYEMVLKAGDMERCMRDFAYHLEEPRVGQSYPNYYAAKLASKFVKVVLAGTAGDELFAGYPWRYYRILNSKNFDKFIDNYYSFWQRLLNHEELKNLFKPIWKEIKDVDTKEIFKNVFLKNDYISSLSNYSEKDFLNMCLYFDAKTFLHGLLVVEDKLSMAHSLETRVPFLDNEFVDFSMKIPIELKLNYSNLPRNHNFSKKTNDGKIILRKMLSKYVPEKITKSYKQGFSSPDRSWFKGESIEFVKRKLLNKNAKIYNFMDYTTTKKLIEEHISGKMNKRLFIWSLLNIEEVLEIWF